MFNSKAYRDSLEELLVRFEQDFLEKKAAVKHLLKLCSISTHCTTIVVVEADLGGETKQWLVETNATTDQLRDIDALYGMKSRFECTTIEQMVRGATQEGYTFKVIKERTEKGPWRETTDRVYFCATGNY